MRIMKAFVAALLALSGPATAQPMAPWQGEYFQKKEGGVYAKLVNTQKELGSLMAIR